MILYYCESSSLRAAGAPFCARQFFEQPKEIYAEQDLR